MYFFNLTSQKQNFFKNKHRKRDQPFSNFSVRKWQQGNVDAGAAHSSAQKRRKARENARQPAAAATDRDRPAGPGTTAAQPQPVQLPEDTVHEPADVLHAQLTTSGLPAAESPAHSEPPVQIRQRAAGPGRERVGRTAARVDNQRVEKRQKPYRSVVVNFYFNNL